jgi:hypothetical protein
MITLSDAGNEPFKWTPGISTPGNDAPAIAVSMAEMRRVGRKEILTLGICPVCDARHTVTDTFGCCVDTWIAWGQ